MAVKKSILREFKNSLFILLKCATIENMKNILGLRTIKTAIAVVLSIYIGQLLKVEYPFFIAMTAVISMDKTMGNSFKMGRNRVLGTLMGACIGVCLSYIDRGNALLCGVGSILLILLCNQLELQGSITIGCIVMLAILVHTDKTPLFYGFHRTFDTFLGAGLSFGVNLLISPYANSKRLDEMVIALWEQTDCLVNFFSKQEPIDLSKIKKEIENLHQELLLYKNEYFISSKKELIQKLEHHYEMGQHLLLEAEILETIDREHHEDIYDFHVRSALQVYHDYTNSYQKNIAL